MADKETFPDSIEACHVLISQQDEVNESLAHDNQRLKHENEQLKRFIYGQRSERHVEDESQLKLFEHEQDAVEEPSSGEQVIEEEITYRRRKRKKSDRFPENLPRQVHEIDVDEKDRLCPCCGEEIPVFDFDERERLEYVPAKLIVHLMRYLKRACGKTAEGERTPRDRGTPQGGVASPLLANIFLHHVFDQWISREFPDCPFERYADDAVIHCGSFERAEEVKQTVEARLEQCHLEAHPEKTCLVYCRDSNRRNAYPQIQFRFLGYDFRPRRAKKRQTETYFTSFAPAISRKAKQAIAASVRQWGIHAASDKDLLDFSRMFGARIRGWLNYYGCYYRSACGAAFACINRRLVRWAMKKYKRFRNRQRRATQWLRRIARRSPELFAHWEAGFVP